VDSARPEVDSVSPLGAAHAGGENSQDSAAVWGGGELVRLSSSLYQRVYRFAHRERHLTASHDDVVTDVQYAQLWFAKRRPVVELRTQSEG